MALILCAKYLTLRNGPIEISKSCWVCVSVKRTKKENVTNLKAKEKANNLFICINLHMCAFDPNHFILLFYFFLFLIWLSFTLCLSPFKSFIFVLSCCCMQPLLVYILYSYSCVAIAVNDIVVVWFFRSIFACCPEHMQTIEANDHINT